jgi:hypothetical protein
MGCATSAGTRGLGPFASIKVSIHGFIHVVMIHVVMIHVVMIHVVMIHVVMIHVVMIHVMIRRYCS